MKVSLAYLCAYVFLVSKKLWGGLSVISVVQIYYDKVSISNMQGDSFDSTFFTWRIPLIQQFLVCNATDLAAGLIDRGR